eukprot:24500-Pleurochrysis_carterae.AAC.3
MSRQILFAVEVTHNIASRWAELEPAISAVLTHCFKTSQACPNVQYAVLLLYPPTRPGEQTRCVPSGMTAEPTLIKHWLQNVPLHTAPLGNVTLLDGLLAAARGTPWDENAASRHIVLVTNTAPCPLPDAEFTRLDSSAIWAPVPDELAMAGIALSIISPREIEPLLHLQSACDKARGLSPLVRAADSPDVPFVLLEEELFPGG